MGNLSGQMATALLAGVLLAVGLAWVVSSLSRRRMLALMRGGVTRDVGNIGAIEATEADVGARAAKVAKAAVGVRHPPPIPDVDANRRASRRLLFLLSGLSVLVAMTQSWLALSIQFEALSLSRFLLLGAIYAWPMVLAWGLALRWPWRAVLAGIAIYLALMIALVMLRSTAQQTLSGVVVWLFTEVGVPLVIALAIGASGRIRAVAPYLLPFSLVLTSASILVLAALSADVGSGSFVVAPIVNVLGAWGTLIAFALAPWLLLAWPVFALARRLALAYRRKRFSDLGYLFAAYWFVVLGCNALPAVASIGVAGLGILLPWLWLPLAGWLLALRQPSAGNPPSLLVLRVFHQDAQVERLFDQVVERWRFTGNTMLIAGTDLVSRTLDPDDLFVFVDGQLERRFVNEPADVAMRLGDFDLDPDPDGRYRVNECYCRDTTWELALSALVADCDLVLMDLRGFQPNNLGCRHELRVLADAGHLRRVVVLHDERTARQAAEADMAGAPTGRFRWIDAGRMNTAKAREVLGALLTPA